MTHHTLEMQARQQRRPHEKVRSFVFRTVGSYDSLVCSTACHLCKVTPVGQRDDTNLSHATVPRGRARTVHIHLKGRVHHARARSAPTVSPQKLDTVLLKRWKNFNRMSKAPGQRSRAPTPHHVPSNHWQQLTPCVRRRH